MARRYDKGVSGSVQARNGYLHLVVGYKDPLTQQRKMKWIAMELPKDAPKSVIEKRKHEARLVHRKQGRVKNHYA